MVFGFVLYFVTHGRTDDGRRKRSETKHETNDQRITMMMMAALRATTTTTTKGTTMMLGRETMRVGMRRAKKTPIGGVRAGAVGGGNDPRRGMASESSAAAAFSPQGSRTPVMRKKRGVNEPLVFPPAYSYPLASGTASPMLAVRMMDFEDTMRDFMDAFMRDPFGAGLTGGGPLLRGDKIPAKTELAKPMDVGASFSSFFIVAS